MLFLAFLDKIAKGLITSVQEMIMLCRNKANFILPWALSRRSIATSQKGAISKHFTYHQAPAKENDGATRQPRVLFFPWLGATKRGIQKYVDLYHEEGMDVIQMHCNYNSQFLWPKSVRTVTSEITDSVHKMVEGTDDTFLVHAASIGAYAYTVFNMDMSSHDEYSHIRDRIVGHVFDSIVIGGLTRMATGIATNSTSNSLLQSAIIQSTLLYFKLTKKHTTDFYDVSVDYFHSNLSGRPGTPYLFYHCGNDALSDPESMKHLLQIWRKDRQLHVLDKYWPQSIHAGHLRLYQEEYLKLFKEYMDIVKKVPPKTSIAD